MEWTALLQGHRRTISNPTISNQLPDNEQQLHADIVEGERHVHAIFLALQIPSVFTLESNSLCVSPFRFDALGLKHHQKADVPTA
jgi:hypothetical protein